ncbi:MAG TPA: hypothetical protein VK843_05370 [Planctomycetota bacterium]|nr:hypothetical protein [Planctomycetota bacterium]
MKVIGFALALILLVAAVLVVTLAKHDASPPTETILASFEPPVPAVRESSPPAPAPPEDSARMLERLNQAISKLENLEISVREARNEIILRTQERSRTEVTAYPSNARSRLGDQDLENLRTMIREELAQEAWRARQVQIVGVVRNLVAQMPLEPKTVDPLIEVLCANGRTMFDLERVLAGENHERGLARRIAPDFKQARRRLRDDLGSIYRNDELAARLFLHVASEGEIAALRMDRDRLLATEKEWLR